jgi:hypothetical protein
MTSSSAYNKAARAYAQGVRALLAPVIPEVAEHATATAPAAPSVTRQAATVARRSAKLRTAAAADLTAPDADERARASTRLLAQALTDLQMSAFLLDIADQGGAVRGVRAPVESALLDDVEANLAILLDGAAEPGTTRAVILPPDIPSARSQLAAQVAVTLNLVEERAAKTGQTALSGLLVLGLGQVAQAAGIVGLDIAQALGVGEKVSRLYALVREYALNAYEALVSLLGPAIAQTAAQQVMVWINDVAAGQQFEKLLAQLYGTQETLAHLDRVVTDSQADLAGFALAIQGIDGLSTTFQEQFGLVEKLLRGFRFVGGAAIAAIPQATVLMAAAYLVIIGYAVLAGADYVDAERVRFLNRVPGVRQVVETNLAGGVA